MSESVKKENFFNKIGRFFREVKGEMKKVAWPTWAQTVNNTMIVIAVIILVAAFLTIVDAIFGILVMGVVTQDFGKALLTVLTFQ